MKNIIKIFSFFLIPSIILSKEIKTLNLETEKLASLNSKENSYYEITIPSNITAQSKFLLISLTPNTDLDRLDNIFSDPNIYISKKEKYPNEKNAEWKSEKYGDDIISIHSDNIIPNEKFYINIYCQSKCNYKIKALLKDKYSIEENIFYSIVLNKGEAIKIEFTSRNNYNKFSLSCIGEEMIPFRIYLSNKNPSSSNTYSSFPIYTNGYRFIIKKGDKNYYTNSIYEILVENKGTESLSIKLYLNYDNEEETLKEYQSIFDSSEKFSSKCYNYKINEDYKNKDLIISIMIFSGYGKIRIGGWNTIKDMKYEDVPNDDFTYEISNDKVIKLTKKNFEKFKGNYNKYIHFCFFSTETSSYLLKIYYLENTEKIQNLNILYPGKYLNEYLPIFQITKYKTELYNIQKDINIIHEKKIGNSKLYAYYCKEDPSNCIISKQKLLDLKEEKKLIESTQTTLKGNEIKIKSKENECLTISSSSNKKCTLLIIVDCEDDSIECEYKIGFDHDNSTLIMQPRTYYSNVITEKEIDKYRIDIYDEDVKNFAVVLNQNSGKTDLSVYKISLDESEVSLIEVKLNNEFLPNVISVKSDKLKVKNLKGSYLINITGRIFSSYTLYYYTYEESDNLEHKTVSMKLELGQIIQDFFPDKRNIKVYSFENKLINEQKKNLYVTLTKINIDCTVYIYDDLDNFEYNKKTNIISGYIYKSDYNNQILIRKTDNKYISNKIFYIMVVKNLNEYSSVLYNSKSSYSSFHIGITDEETPFLLSEGIQHKLVLTTEYQKQTYFYNHEANDKNSLIISIYSTYGKLISDINIGGKNYSNSQSLNELTYIKIEPKEIKKYCKIPSSCKVEITLYKNYYYNTNYLLVCRSSIHSYEILSPGQITKKTIFSGEYQYYIIDTIPDENLGIRINTIFLDGYGEIYINTNLNNTNLTNNFPNRTKYEYANIDKYNSEGQNLIIPVENIKIKGPIRLFITIFGALPSYASNRLEYTISFTNLINELETNKNYQFYIIQGEYQFFKFNINKRVKRIYITMTNKIGDADLFLNYGKQFPTVKNYTWKSKGGYNEFIDVTYKDNFFSEMGLTDIMGEYSLMIKSYGNYSYNLFISNENVKLLHISESSPNGCSTNEKNEICYFRYENINDASIKELKNKEVIFYIEYTYGSGNIFATLFKNGNYENIMGNLPNIRKYEYINENRYSYLKVKLERKNKKYTIDSVIIVGVECLDKCLFDMSVVQLKTEEDIIKNKYLSIDKDNIFYLSPNKKEDYIFNYYFSNYNQNLNFEIRSYEGNGFIRVYINGTIYDSINRTSKVDYHHIADYEIKQENEKPISKSIDCNISKYHTVYFQVKPRTDFIFFIHLNYASDWIKLPIGKISNHVLTKTNFYCYFDFLSEMSEVIVTINNKSSNKKILFFSKLNILDKEKLNEDFYYSVPSISNFDFKGESNNILPSVSFKAKNIPNELITNKSKIVRMLILIKIEGFYYGDNKISILVSPNVNNYQRIISQQGLYYFSSLTNLNKDKTIFNLIKKNKDDNLMIIEISSCQGEFGYSLTDTISSTKENSKENNVFSNHLDSLGKKTILVKDLQKSEYYLYIWGTKEDDINCLINKEKCNSDIEFLMYYYTIKSESFNQTIYSFYFEYENIGNGKILIKLPKILKKNTANEEKTIDIDVRLFVTKESKEYKYFESICYLSKKVNNEIPEKDFNYTYNKDKNQILVTGLKNKENYLMNVLLNNIKTGEIYTLKPMLITPSYGNYNLLIIIICAVILLIIVGIAFYFYKKYKTTKEILNYEVNDIRNLSSIPKSIAEMRDISQKKEKEKYASLTEDTNEI